MSPCCSKLRTPSAVRPLLFPSPPVQVPLLAPLTSRQRLALCTSLSPRAAAAGETLVSKGEAGDTFFLIEEGSCVVVGEDGKVGRRVIEHLGNRCAVCVCVMGSARL